MIAIQNADDFEFYSSNSAGGIQGHGYQCRNAGYVGPPAERGSDTQFDACIHVLDTYTGPVWSG